MDYLSFLLIGFLCFQEVLTPTDLKEFAIYGHCKHQKLGTMRKEVLAHNILLHTY